MVYFDISCPSIMVSKLENIMTMAGIVVGGGGMKEMNPEIM